MNDIHNIIIPNAEIICYADDTAVLFTNKDWPSTFLTAEQGMEAINKWMQHNLLTINKQKTNYLCFHKTAASQPLLPTKLQIHNCNKLVPDKNCNCDTIQQSQTIKYLGLIIDQNLNFKDHIEYISKRIRKTSAILKKLNKSANDSILKIIYTAICQSIITYCISVWGSVPKTTLITAERAQRSVLKIMLRKPYRHPTRNLYQEAQVLTVRQLFVLRMCINTQKRLSTYHDYQALQKKRVFKLPTPRTKTFFGRRFGDFLRAHTYNSVLKHCDLKNLTVSETKSKLSKWLQTLDYLDTENILNNCN